ncbi:MAG: hypothetical protein IH960_01825 [Chloroflexi bacterium]|nr:hypothetical protein [Chloroflexota bacterium]MCH8911124.1 hypothetical protein [Chloroflexota bacterium]
MNAKPLARGTLDVGGSVYGIRQLDHTEIFRGIVLKITYIEYEAFVWPELEMCGLYLEIMGGAWY